MDKFMTSRKGQLSIESGFVLLFLLIVMAALWLGGPLQQSTEKSTDTNDLILAVQAADAIAVADEIIGMSGNGARRDFMVHVPFNTVDIQYGSDKYTLNGEAREGPHINFTVLLYNNVTLPAADKPLPLCVDGDGNPSFLPCSSPSAGQTPFFYKTVTQPLRFPLGNSPFCKVKKPSNETRGQATMLVDVSGKPISFCCEAGFNLNMYIEKGADLRTLSLRPRYYYGLPGDWIITT